MLAELLGYGRDDRRIESAAEQYAIGNIGHQLALHGVFQRIAKSIDACLVILHRIIIEPVALVVAFHARLSAPVIMPGQEGLVPLALPFERLQFGGNIHGAVAVIAYIERYHADGVSGYQKLVLLFIIKCKGKDAADVLEEVDAFVAIERKDDLAVAARLEVILAGILAANLLVIVNLAVDGQHLLPVGREKRLPAAFGIDDGEPFMGKDG